MASNVHAESLVDRNFERVDPPDTRTNEQPSISMRDGSIVVVPVPFQNPMMGTGLALGAGYLFKADPDSKNSVIGIGGFKTSNGSNGVGLSGSIAWDSNRWIANATIAEALLNYDLFVAGIPIPIRQSGRYVQGGLSYGINKHLSFGGKARYLDSTISLDSGGIIPPDLLPDVDLRILSFSGVTSYDTRDDSFYGTQGVNAKFELQLGKELDSDDRAYIKGFATYDHFHSIRENTVITARATLCSAEDDTPFFDKCSLGGTDGFRGFSATQFLNNRLASIQGEIRQRIGKRIGVVAFAGVGYVGPDTQAMWSSGTRAAYGLGLRIRLSKKFPLDFSVDYARNDDRANFLYIYAGNRW